MFLWVSILSYVQTNTTTPNTIGLTMWVVVWKLPTMLEPAAHCGNDTTHKTLEIMCNVHAWHQQCCKSCANGSNIVVLRFSDHRTKEMLGVVDSKVWPVSNFAQQLPTTCNKMCKQTEHVTFNNVGSCWPTMLDAFAHVGLYMWIQKFDNSPFLC